MVKYRLNRFILNTDFAMLKNDDDTTLSVNIPANFTLAPSETRYFRDTLKVGTRNSPLRSNISSSKDGVYRPGQSISDFLNATIMGQPAFGISYSASVYRTDADTLTLEVMVNNPYSDSATITGPAQTITADVFTFLSPFN